MWQMEIAELEAITSVANEPEPGMPKGAFWRPDRVRWRREKIAILRGHARG